MTEPALGHINFVQLQSHGDADQWLDTIALAGQD